jgi:hypothetical protein
MSKVDKRKVMKIILLVLTISFLVAPVSNAGAFLEEVDYPLPPDLNIIKPGDDVDPELAGFSGAWEGQWRKHPHLYIFEKITPTDAFIVHSNVGRSGRKSLSSLSSEPKWRRHKAKVIILDNGHYMIEYKDKTGILTQFRRTERPNYIQGIRWGIVYKYDGIPINFEKKELEKRQ